MKFISQKSLEEEIEILTQKINEIERKSDALKDNPFDLENTKKDRDKLEFFLRRDLIKNPSSEDDFWANINWFRENGTLDDIDLLIEVKRCLLSSDQQSKFILMINTALKKIFERSMNVPEGTQPRSETLTEYRKAEILRHVQALALEVLEDERRAEAWLTTPIPSLDYKIPLSLLDTETGAAKVEYILNCIDAGVIS